MDYTALCERSLWKTEGYDYVIVNLGSWPDEKSVTDCDELICALNCEKCEIEKYREFILHRTSGQCFIPGFLQKLYECRIIRKLFVDENCFVLEQLFLPFSI